MKNLILIMAILVFVGCKEEIPTENNINLNKEYTLEELENDTNWVEVTDIDTINRRLCIWSDVIELGEIVNSLNELEELYIESDELNREKINNCHEFDSLDLDFEKRTIVLYFIDWLDMYAKRRIYKNSEKKTYVYIVELGKGTEWTAPLFADLITIPKLESNYTFIFDSVIVDGE